MIQAGLRKAFDFNTTVAFMEGGGWRLPKFRRLHGDRGRDGGWHRPSAGIADSHWAACAVIAAMIDAWAVIVSAATFWSDPFNVPFLVAVGAAALLFQPGAGAYSVDARIFGRWRFSPRVAMGLLILAVAAALLTWILLTRDEPDPLHGPGRLADRLHDLASLVWGYWRVARETYPAVRIATIFRIVTQRTLNGDGYCPVTCGSTTPVLMSSRLTSRRSTTGISWLRGDTSEQLDDEHTPAHRSLSKRAPSRRRVHLRQTGQTGLRRYSYFLSSLRPHSLPPRASTMSASRPVIRSSASSTMRDTSSPTVGMSLIRPIAVPNGTRYRRPGRRFSNNLDPAYACDQVLDVGELAALV